MSHLNYSEHMIAVERTRAGVFTDARENEPSAACAI